MQFLKEANLQCEYCPEFRKGAVALKEHLETDCKHNPSQPKAPKNVFGKFDHRFKNG
jgi:hypothetical protein